MEEVLEESIAVVEEKSETYFVLLNNENGKEYFSGNWSTTRYIPGSIEVISMPPTCDVQKAKCYYLENDEWLLDEEKYDVVVTKREIATQIVKNRNKIRQLKAQLESTDYMVIKCYEYSLIGQELPYDIAALHEERQAIRDEINALETAAIT